MNPIENIAELWFKVRPIKKRCQNISAEELAMVDELVNAFRVQVPTTTLKVSGCQIPRIIHTIGKYLIAHGIINTLSDTTYSEPKYIPPV